MSDQIEQAPKIDPAIRDSKISRKARVARHLQKIALYGTQDDKKAYRSAAHDRDKYIDSFAGDAL